MNPLTTAINIPLSYAIGAPAAIVILLLAVFILSFRLLRRPRLADLEIDGALLFLLLGAPGATFRQLRAVLPGVKSRQLYRLLVEHERNHHWIRASLVGNETIYTLTSRGRERVLRADMTAQLGNIQSNLQLPASWLCWRPPLAADKATR